MSKKHCSKLIKHQRKCRTFLPFAFRLNTPAQHAIYIWIHHLNNGISRRAFVVAPVIFTVSFSFFSWFWLQYIVTHVFPQRNYLLAAATTQLEVDRAGKNNLLQLKTFVLPGFCPFLALTTELSSLILNSILFRQPKHVPLGILQSAQHKKPHRNQTTSSDKKGYHEPYLVCIPYPTCSWPVTKTITCTGM